MKKYIIGLISGLIMASCTIGIVYAIGANEVIYNNTTVDQALNTLYTNQTNIINDYSNKFDEFNLSIASINYNDIVNSHAMLYLNTINNKYNYFNINSIENTVGSGTCSMAGRNNTTNSIDELQINNNYTNTYDYIFLRSKTTTEFNECRCVANITFHN